VVTIVQEEPVAAKLKIIFFVFEMDDKVKKKVITVTGREVL
jgi:hypothetical protein